MESPTNMRGQAGAVLLIAGVTGSIGSAGRGEADRKDSDGNPDALAARSHTLPTGN